MSWLSNVVVTEKKISRQICMNKSMRHANLTIQESHIPVPTVHTLQRKLYGSTIFTKLNLRNSFHQMLLGQRSRQLTNFYAHEGICFFKRLVMEAGPANQEFYE